MLNQPLAIATLTKQKNQKKDQKIVPEKILPHRKKPTFNHKKKISPKAEKPPHITRNQACMAKKVQTVK